MKLLDRDTFRESVFKRDGYRCVLCDKTEDLAAHHIIERRLWPDGGYYIENGGTLCPQHHIEAETTDLSCETIREAAGISEVVLPPDYYQDHVYSKWGDVILPNGRRMKGPLFDDESVQKILKLGNSYHLYTDYVKYPRTPHFPWSEGKTEDDRTLDNCDHFTGKIVVITEKLDGENASIYKDYYHARSIDGRNHWSRSYIKNLQARIGWALSEGWRICCENLYAVHSIKYYDLEDYVYGLSIWNEKNICLSWEDTVEYFQVLGLPYPKVLYHGTWDEDYVKHLYTKEDRNYMEGYVVRITDAFAYGSFSKSVAKFVRAGHVDSNNHHWLFSATEKNELK